MRRRAACAAGICRDDGHNCGVTGAPEPASVVQMFFSTSAPHHFRLTWRRYLPSEQQHKMTREREMLSRSLTPTPTGTRVAMAEFDDLRLDQRAHEAGPLKSEDQSQGLSALCVCRSLVRCSEVSASFQKFGC